MVVLHFYITPITPHCVFACSQLANCIYSRCTRDLKEMMFSSWLKQCDLMNPILHLYTTNFVFPKWCGYRKPSYHLDDVQQQQSNSKSSKVAAGAELHKTVPGEQTPTVRFDLANWKKINIFWKYYTRRKMFLCLILYPESITRELQYSEWLSCMDLIGGDTSRNTRLKSEI